MADTTTRSPERGGKESTMDFASIVAGTLPAGTPTEHGTIVRASLTAYEVEGGRWVPFHAVHGRPQPVTPLVVFG